MCQRALHVRTLARGGQWFRLQKARVESLEPNEFYQTQLSEDQLTELAAWLRRDSPRFLRGRARTRHAAEHELTVWLRRVSFHCLEETRCMSEVFIFRTDDRRVHETLQQTSIDSASVYFESNCCCYWTANNHKEYNARVQNNIIDKQHS